MSQLPLRPLGFGEIVDGAVQIYRRDFGLYYLIALLGAFPGYVLRRVTGADAAAFSDPEADPLAMLGDMVATIPVWAASALIAWVGFVAVATAMATRIDEQPVSVGGAYRASLRHLPGATGASLLAMLLFGAVMIVVVLVGSVIAAALVSTGSAFLSLAGFLFMVLVVGVVTMFWAGATFGILPAVIREGRGATDALQRSLKLCQGGWLRVIGIMVVAFIIQSAPSLGITALFGMGDLFTSPEALATVDAREQWLLSTADLVIGPLTTPYLVGSIMVLFHDRRVRSEAFDLEVLAGEMEAP